MINECVGVCVRRKVRGSRGQEDFMCRQPRAASRMHGHTGGRKRGKARCRRGKNAYGTVWQRCPLLSAQTCFGKAPGTTCQVNNTCGAANSRSKPTRARKASSPWQTADAQILICERLALRAGPARIRKSPTLHTRTSRQSSTSPHTQIIVIASLLAPSNHLL